MDLVRKAAPLPEESRRGAPRATRLMIDVFDAIAACADLIHYWDVTKRPGGGVLIKATSQRRYASCDAAAGVAREMADRLGPEGHRARVLTALGRPDGVVDEGWQAFVEVLVE